MPTNATIPRIQTFDGNGDVYAGAKLYFFVAGTTTPLTTYQDEALTTPHTHPVVADGAGRFPLIYLSPTKYKLRLDDVNDVTIFEEDNLSPAIALDGSGGFVVGGPSDITGGKPGYILASTGDSGVSVVPATADDLMAESDGDVGMTLASPNSSSARWVASDPDNPTAFVMQFDHATDTWQILIQSQTIITATTALITLGKNTSVNGTFSVTGVSTFTGGIKTNSITGISGDMTVDVPAGQSLLLKNDGVQIGSLDDTGNLVISGALVDVPPVLSLRWDGGLNSTTDTVRVEGSITAVTTNVQRGWAWNSGAGNGYSAIPRTGVYLVATSLRPQAGNSSELIFEEATDDTFASIVQSETFLVDDGTAGFHVMMDLTSGNYFRLRFVSGGALSDFDDRNSLVLAYHGAAI